MGNSPSSSSSSRRRDKHSAAERVKKVVDEVQEEIKKKLDDQQFLDAFCGGGLFDSRSKYSEDAYSEDGSRTISEDDATYDDRSRRSRADNTIDNQSFMSQSDYDSDHHQKRRGGRRNSFDTEDTRTDASSAVAAPAVPLQKQPLASSFAKRCYFTKAGIGRTTQHYEGLTLTGNVVLMLASAMKLKGCPTICDEDLRRVEQTYPNQFSRLPDELLLSSGWRRISKYCHFSNKPIPDGVPFFHSKQRLHPSGGYYFLLAAAVGMTRPMDVEPLNRDTLVLLETDYPSQCDAAPSILIKDHEQWTLVNKFCFFSGGPINTEEDVYYQADFDGNPIYMLAFLSPSLTPDELYKLNEADVTLKTVQQVQDVETVYDLTERDFDDLKLYHLGPCRALPQYILQPQAWTKVLPPHFLAARQQAMIRADDYMVRNPDFQSGADDEYYGEYAESVSEGPEYVDDRISPGLAAELQREVQEEGAFHNDDGVPMGEPHIPPPGDSPSGIRLDMSNSNDDDMIYADPITPKLDPPEDEPPSLHKASSDWTEPPPPEPEDPTVMLSPHVTVGSNAFFKHEPLTPDDEPETTPYPQDEFTGAIAAVRSRPQPIYTTLSPTQHEYMEDTEHFAYEGEEKKQQLEIDSMKSGEEDFIPIKRNPYQLTPTGGGHRPAGTPNSVDSMASHHSAAFKSAQEVLRKNRRRRQEETIRQEEPSKPTTPSIEEAASEGTWDSGSDVSGSNATGSSLWSDNGADRSSRRALILQMAKARMRNNKESPTKSVKMIDEEAGSTGGHTDANLDFAADLD